MESSGGATMAIDDLIVNGIPCVLNPIVHHHVECGLNEDVSVPREEKAVGDNRSARSSRRSVSESDVLLTSGKA
jgi:hypothetical protein